MRKASFYPKLAAQNIKQNRKFYLPYILSAVITVSMFYNMCYLTYSQGMQRMDSASLGFIFMLGCIVIGIFSTIFLFYTNSFLMKRRQKELGLYNILGMGKGNIAGVLFFETLFVGLLSIVGGLLLGLLISKLLLLLLCSLLQFEVVYGFELCVPAVLITLALFFADFFLILISNLVRIKLSNPIELLHGGNVGEKEPKTKWVLAILGALSLAGGYYIALTQDSPLKAIALFFVAVLLVIIGTYFLFTAGSIAILKRLKASHGYYYKTKHFIPVSGMIYRMKQNAVGLANICILSTMVLVMVSGTVCLYLGTEDSIKSMDPNEIYVNVSGPTGNTRENVRSLVNEVVAKEGYEMTNVSDYEGVNIAVTQQGNELLLPDERRFYDQQDTILLCFLSESEYVRLGAEAVNLADNEVLEFSPTPINDNVTIFGDSFVVKGEAADMGLSQQVRRMIAKYFFFVLSDDAYAAQCEKLPDYAKPNWYYGFDFEGSPEEKLALYDKVSNAAYSADSDSIDGGFYSLGTGCRESSRGPVYEMTGGFLFLGLFLGIIFLMATALIIYYKQLSEGYDDRERFEIMQKVGLSQKEIKKAIHSQIVVVFFLPLCMAIVHIAFAFKIITELLTVFNLTNIALFFYCTIATVAIFAAIYGIVYAITAKAYYNIVSE